MFIEAILYIDLTVLSQSKLLITHESKSVLSGCNTVLIAWVHHVCLNACWRARTQRAEVARRFEEARAEEARQIAAARDARDRASPKSSPSASSAKCIKSSPRRPRAENTMQLVAEEVRRAGSAPRYGFHLVPPPLVAVTA